jgi:hypothetical protein
VTRFIVEGIADDALSPEARYTSRHAVQLAFVASAVTAVLHM